MRSAATLVILIVGCSAPARRIEPAPPAPDRVRPTEPAIAEPGRPPARPTQPSREPGERERRIILEYEGRPRGWDRPAADVAESDLWDACVRDYVRSQDEAARRALTVAFSRFVTRCEPNGDFVVSPPYERRDRAHLSFEGRFMPAQAQREILLRVATCGPPQGAPTTAPTRIAIVSDRGRWISPRFSYERQRNCDVALIPYSSSVGRALREAIEASDTLVRIDGGEPAADDLIVTDEMKQDLRVMLDALEALTAR